MKKTLIALAALIPAALSAQSVDYYRPPLDIPIYLSANFGEIRTNRFHTGVDIKTAGVVGKPLYAAADGYIARVTVAPGGYGRALHIAHPNGTTTTYAHLDRFTGPVEEWLKGERYRLRQNDVSVFPEAGRFPVKQGDAIGVAGNSGASGGPHLHYEIRRSADQRPMNAVARGWVRTAEPDDLPPRIVRLYHVDVDTVAGVPVHSTPRVYEVTRNGEGDHTLARTVPLKAGRTSWFAIEATDRRGDATNTFGIFRALMSVDGEGRVVFEKDEVLFDDIRYACASVLYEIQRKSAWGHETVMLATKSGNRLPMYKKAVDRGAITFEGDQTAVKHVTIAVEDDAGNRRTLDFDVEHDPAAATPAERPEGRIARGTANFVHAEDGLAVAIPRGALYEPIFYTQSIVEAPLAPRGDDIRPRSPLYRTGDGTMPLHAAMKLGIEIDLPEGDRSKACLAKVSPDGKLTWAGGRWSRGSVNGSSRDFGTFCVVVDDTPPTVKASFADGGDLTKAARVVITAADNFSGIAAFEGSIDGEWIIFERDAARGRFTHRFDAEKLRPGRTHTFEFRCRDGVGNSTVWRGTFRK